MSRMVMQATQRILLFILHLQGGGRERIYNVSPMYQSTLKCLRRGGCHTEGGYSFADPVYGVFFRR